MLERNVGDIDRALRLILGIALMIIGVIGQQLLFFVISFLLIISSVTGVCVMYRIFRINTKTQIDHPYIIPDKSEVPEIPQQTPPEETETNEEEPIVRRRVKRNGKKK
ncbi:MAG: DUF2892 domain-containing protein [Candidatus Micrarchaeota archaeon]|nr:DUF2892 domain-containing protein [Candidatus Micrarchaeota archaeon]MCX8154558.1 DUF2892 domain-containing protein [Candidatus Micrarchaeota archaeon]